MEQTAVEWLEQKMDGTINTMPAGNRSIVKKLLSQSKELEKQQIIDANNVGYSAGRRDISESAEEYYNRTFKNK